MRLLDGFLRSMRNSDQTTNGLCWPIGRDLTRRGSWPVNFTIIFEISTFFLNRIWTMLKKSSFRILPTCSPSFTYVRKSFECFLNDPAAIHLEGQLQDLMSYALNNLSFLFIRSKFQKFLDHIISENINNKLVWVMNYFVENKLTISCWASFQLLLNKTATMLVLSRLLESILHENVGKTSGEFPYKSSNILRTVPCENSNIWLTNSRSWGFCSRLFRKSSKSRDRPVIPSKLPIDRVGADGNDNEPELNRPESPP